MKAKHIVAAGVACASLSLAATGYATDIPDHYFYLGGHVSQSWMDIGDHYDGDGFTADEHPSLNRLTLPGAQLGWRFNKDWSVQGWWERNQAHLGLSDGTNQKVYISNAFLSLRRHFNTDSTFEPYAGFGLGQMRTQYNSTRSDDFIETTAGPEFGLLTGLTRHLVLDLGARPTYGFHSERWDAQIYAGLNLLVGTSYDKQETTVADSDGDGVPDNVDQCPGTPAGAQVDARGCALDSDGDGVPDYKDQCPNTPKGALVDETGCQKYLTQDVTQTLHVEFAFDKAVVSKSYYSELEGLANKMYQYPSADLELDGYTDSIGAKAYNQKLSEQRVQAVKKVMVDHFGIDSARITATGHGEANPVASNDTREGRAENRRVEATMKATVKKAQYN